MFVGVFADGVRLRRFLVAMSMSDGWVVVEWRLMQRMLSCWGLVVKKFIFDWGGLCLLCLDKDC